MFCLGPRHKGDEQQLEQLERVHCIFTLWFSNFFILIQFSSWPVSGSDFLESPTFSFFPPRVERNKFSFFFSWLIPVINSIPSPHYLNPQGPADLAITLLTHILLPFNGLLPLRAKCWLSTQALRSDCLSSNHDAATSGEFTVHYLMSLPQFLPLKNWENKSFCFIGFFLHEDCIQWYTEHH